MNRIKLLHNLTIKNKIIVIVLFVTFVVHGIGFTFITFWDINRIELEIKNNLALKAKLIASNCIVPLTFNDAQQAYDALSNLKNTEFIEKGCLFDKDGNLFATYPDSLDTNSVLDLHQTRENILTEGSFYVKELIIYKDEMYGTLFIKASTKPLEIARRNIILTLLLLSLVLTILAVILANKLQQLVSWPIISLKNHFDRVAKNSDFSQKIKKIANDEVGSLYDGFNNLLNHINIKQQELTSSLLQLKQAQKVAKVGSWYWNLKTNKLDWSNEMYELYGVPKDIEDKIEGVKKLIVPEDLETFEAAMMKINDTDIPTNIEYRVKRNDGSTIHIEANLEKISDKAGNVITLIGTAQDITERKHAEKEIRSLLNESEKSGQVLLSILEDEQMAQTEIKELNNELEQKVKERTAQLETKYDELEKMNKIFVGRELRMIELKKTIKQLKEGKNIDN